MGDADKILQDNSSPSFIQPPSITSASTNLSVLNDVEETPETYVFEHFKFGCEIAANSDGDEEWDFLNDFKPIVPLPAKIALETGKDEKISDDDNEDWEVLNDFKCLIPLPSEIALKTGKYEEIIFEDQAKLYKLVDKEWKEQNLCIVKILHDTFNGSVRLIMNRAEVLKACANHYITSDMEIHPSKNLDQAWTWVAQEFVNEMLEPEHICIRFEDTELADAFKVAFIKAVDITKGVIGNNSRSPKVEAIDSPFVSRKSRLKFASKPAFWCCPLCETTNSADKFYCVICETFKPLYCTYCESFTGGDRCFCSRECDTYSSFPIIYDTDVAQSSIADNVNSSKVSATDSHVISKSCGSKCSSTESSCCRPLHDTNIGADNHLSVICEASKPFCCSECNIYAMLSDDDMSSDDDSHN